MVDPLRRAVHGSTVELLRGSIHETIRGSVNLTRKDAETERYLRKALLRVPQLDGSDETHLKRMVAAMEQVRVAPREIICRIGDPGDFLYAIQSGRVELRGEHHNQLLQPALARRQTGADVHHGLHARSNFFHELTLRLLNSTT